MSKSTLYFLVCFSFVWKASAEKMKQRIWTLESSINRLVDVSETISSFNDATKSTKELIDSSRLPNPELEIGATNEFKIQAGKSGYDYNSITISQRFPLAELLYGKNIDKVSYDRSLSDKDDLILKLKLRFSLLFRELQYKRGLYDLANRELFLLNGQVSKKKQKLVRFQSPLDKTKMQLIISDVFIGKKRIEEQIHEIEARIKSYLKIPRNDEFNVTSIKQLKKINYDLSKAVDHPMIKSLATEKVGIERKISKEKAKRFGEIEITAFNQREIVINKPVDTNGALIKFNLPFWDWRGSQIKSLSYKKSGLSNKLNSIRRTFKNERETIYQHYKHQIDLQKLILNTQIPNSKIFLDKTIKSYSAGQANILSLTDAYKEYFDSKKSLLKLQFAGWAEYEELRYITNNFQSIRGTK